MDNTPYTVKRLMRIEYRAQGERGTVTVMGKFANRDDAFALLKECAAEETDPKYTYEVVRLGRPAGLGARLRAQ